MKLTEIIDPTKPLTQLLLAVRHHVIGNRMSHYGDCELIAEAFLTHARGNGLVATDPNDPLSGDGFVVWGWLTYNPDWQYANNREPGEHQWVEINGVIYDGTADQFGYREQEVLVTHGDDPRYRVHRKTNRTFTRATPLNQT